jgi:hypothetical protein
MIYFFELCKAGHIKDFDPSHKIILQISKYKLILSIV